MPAPSAPATSAPAAPHTGRALLLYTLGRFAIFFALAAVLCGLGLGIIAVTGHSIGRTEIEPVVLAAAFIAAPLSMLVSYRLLARHRLVLTAAVERTVTSYREKINAKTAAEDAYVDELFREEERSRDGE